MMIVPVFNTAGVQTGTVSFPCPWNYLYLDPAVQKAKDVETALTATDAMRLGDLEEVLAEERRRWIYVVMESYENKLETDLPDWWKAIPTTAEKRALLAYFITRIVPGWKVINEADRDKVVVVPTEMVGQLLTLGILSNRLLISKLFDWQAYLTEST